MTKDEYLNIMAENGLRLVRTTDMLEICKSGLKEAEELPDCDNWEWVEYHGGWKLKKL